MKLQYSKKVIKYFKNPKNLGKIKKASGIGEYKSLICGDVTTFYIKVKDNKISDIKFVTLGCAVSIAAASVLSEAVKKKTLGEALKVTPKKIAEKLNGLPQSKFHCAVLVYNALNIAIEDYKKKSKT